LQRRDVAANRVEQRLALTGRGQCSGGGLAAPARDDLGLGRLAAPDGDVGLHRRQERLHLRVAGEQ